ncbi:GNAT family N-acetyltransferase [Tepidamorphus sp. 3E244]|uniref:GNAT family N-acetyltransferase n=1 Tax=Tepidamorphus sp. 3E244 TaxID=3385498 RepID=UPI0038FCC071
MDDHHTHDAGGGAVRRLWATESRPFREHLLRLSADSRRMRFAGAVSDEFVEQYANTAISRALVIFGWFEDGKLRAVAELHGSMFADTGEAAFTVETDYQNRRIGSALMKRVVLTARNRNMRRLIVSCLSENAQMRRLAQRHDAEIEFHTGETIGTVHSRMPNGLSLLREAIAEGHGFAQSMIDLQSSVWVKHGAAKPRAASTR